MTDDELERQFDAYERRVRDYGFGWWGRDSGVRQALLADPSLLDRLIEKFNHRELVETSDVYATGPSAWVDLRIPVQQAVLDALFPPMPRRVDDPMAVFLLGMPGSGKSTTLRPLALRLLGGSDGVITRDADEFRVRLPEYAGGLGSHVLQTEVVDLTYVRSATYLGGATHLIVDLVGDPVWLPHEMEHFATLGYRIVVLCADVPAELAEERAKRRAITDGRHVSLSYLRSTAGRPRRALDAALGIEGLVGDWAVIDTSGPQPIVSEGNGRFGRSGEQPTVMP